MRLLFTLPLSLAVAFPQAAMVAAVVANFDDLAENELVPPTSYGLDFGGFFVADPTSYEDIQDQPPAQRVLAGPQPNHHLKARNDVLREAGILEAHSLPNVVAALYTPGTIDGSAQTLTIKYPGSNATSFDLTSTYIGCTQEGVAPVACTLGFQTYHNKETRSKDCPFPGSDALVECTFGDTFKGVESVSVVVRDAKGQDFTMVLDDVAFTLHSD